MKKKHCSRGKWGETVIRKFSNFLQPVYFKVQILKVRILTESIRCRAVVEDLDLFCTTSFSLLHTVLWNSSSFSIRTMFLSHPEKCQQHMNFLSTIQHAPPPPSILLKSSNITWMSVFQCVFNQWTFIHLYTS